jgi:RND family efflux transporter MFP subunit
MLRISVRALVLLTALAVVISPSRILADAPTPASSLAARKLIAANSAGAPNTSAEPTPAADADKDDKKSDSDSTSDAKTSDKDKSDKSSSEKSEKDKKDEKKNTDSAKKDDNAKKDEAKDDAKKDGDKKNDAAKSDDKTAKGEEKEKRKTHKVEPKRLRIDLALEGTFVADKMTEVPLRPDSWSEYEIVEVASLGAKVHKGETLFKFDPKKINEAIEDLELEQRLAELTILKADEELPRVEKTLKMDSEAADRTDRETKEDYKRYTEIDRPMTIKSAEFMLKYYKFNLENAKEELEQLEKMYKADDLTEETEEIVLKRQRTEVEMAEFSLERGKLMVDEVLNVSLPRADIQMKEMLERTGLAKARAETALSLDLKRGRYEQEQRKLARKKALDKHSKLLADRELMEIKSPADGIVYYGQCVNGKWTDASSLEAKYQPHSNVAAGSVLMTIVDERPLTITAQLDEGKLPEVSKGQAAKVALPAEDSDRLDGKVKSISTIPVATGKFEINFTPEADSIPEWIVAGMNCKVNVTTYNKADAIVLPKKAVHDDEADPDKHYVWIVPSDDSDAKAERREVKLGKRKEDDVEITKGLKKGDIVSLEDEDEKAKEKDKDKEKSK